MIRTPCDTQFLHQCRDRRHQTQRDLSSDHSKPAGSDKSENHSSVFEEIHSMLKTWFAWRHFFFTLTLSISHMRAPRAIGQVWGAPTENIEDLESTNGYLQQGKGQINSKITKKCGKTFNNLSKIFFTQWLLAWLESPPQFLRWASQMSARAGGRCTQTSWQTPLLKGTGDS